MNDYLGTSHEAIYDMVQLGEPGQSHGWARDVSDISRELGTQIADLREQCARIASVWSDGVGSVRLTADLGAVIEYLQVLADGMSGQSASYANLTVQAAADLAAAQPPSVLPPPPVVSTVDLNAEARQITAASVAPGVKEAEVAQLTREIAANQAARIKAGETATRLDNEYRTALARLTPPPEPPPIVLDAASAGGAPDPALPTKPVAAESLSPGGSVPRVGAAVGGWSVDRYLPGGPTAATPVSAPSGVSPGAGLPGAAAGPTGPAGNPGTGGVTDSTGGVISAGVLAGGSSVLGSSRPGVDPATLHNGIWAGSAAAGIGSGARDLAGQPAAAQFAGSAGSRSGARFDPVTGSAITAGPARFDAAGTADGSGWETAAGVGGIAALAAGAAMLTRGGSGAVTAAGLSGGFGPGGVGSPGGGVGGGPGGVGGSAMGGPGGAGYGPGTGSATAGSARMMGGAPGVGPNSMVQGGQIGQAGRAVSGAAGSGTGRPVAPGSGIGGEHGYRVTWLVEDRDLYGRGPSVKSVIDAPPAAD
jgi:hypothetical protein